jgi:hypothetical protein
MNGTDLIVAERQRQIEAEGWTAEHDDEHKDESLAWAAVCYAAPERVFRHREYAASMDFVDPWPWEQSADARHYDGNVLQDPPTDAARIRLLVKAGALIAAEIDRLSRRAEKG